MMIKRKEIRLMKTRKKSFPIIVYVVGNGNRAVVESRSSLFIALVISRL